MVNEHALLFTWHGSNETLQPVLLTSHLDVSLTLPQLHRTLCPDHLQTVPVAQDTFSEWNYPPFSGHFDGTYINGRGSHDCKNNVVAILASITALLEQDFVPRRTLILAFGYDEESTAYRLGAASLGKVLLDRWGPNSLAIILDEGAIGITKHFGRTVAIP